MSLSKAVGIPEPDNNLVDFGAVAGELVEKAISGESSKRGLLPGYPTLDKYLDFNPGDLVVVGGYTSNGKTTFSLNLLDHWRDKKVLVFAYESEPDAMVDTMLRMNFPGYVSLVSGAGDEEAKIALRGQVESLQDSKITFCNYPVPFEQLRSICHSRKASEGLDVILLDYLQICPTRQRFSSQNEKMIYFSEQLAAMAMELKVVVIAISALRKYQAQEFSGSQLYPGLDDFRDSNSIVYAADKVLTVTSPGQLGLEGIRVGCQTVPTEGMVMIRILKNRKSRGKYGPGIGEIAYLRLKVNRHRMEEYDPTVEVTVC